MRLAVKMKIMILNILYITLTLIKKKNDLCNEAFMCHKMIIKQNTDIGNYLIYSKLQETTDQDTKLYLFL